MHEYADRRAHHAVSVPADSHFADQHGAQYAATDFGSGGGAFEVSAINGPGALTIFDANTATLGERDDAAFQAADPTKPALVTASADYTMTPGDTAHFNAIMYPAKPLADNVGEAKAVPPVYMACSGTEEVSSKMPFMVTYVLPAGWWSTVGVTAMGTGTVAHAYHTDWALG